MSTEEEKTVTPNPHEAQEWWEREFTGKDIPAGELEFARVVVSDYCTDDQRKTLEAQLDSNGATLGSSRTLIKYLAGVGDRLLSDKDQRESSKAASFYGNSMNDEVQQAVTADAKFLINDAIQRATDLLILKGRRPLAGRMHK